MVRTAEDGSSAVQRAPARALRPRDQRPEDAEHGRPRAARGDHAHPPGHVTVIMTGFGTVETAIDAMKRGAYDYILKPFKVEEVVHIVQRGLEKQRLAAENLRLREALSLYKVSEAIAASLSLDEVIATVTDSALHEVAPTSSSTWLDDGEGGYFERKRRARVLHLARRRRSGRCSRRRSVARLATGEPVVEHERARRWSCSPSSPSRAGLEPRHRAAEDARAADRLHRGHSLTASKRFDEGQRKLLSIVASRAAAAIENARLYEDFRRRSSRRSRASRAPSTRWTATRRATPSASRVRGAPRAQARAARGADRDRAHSGADARHRQDRLRDEPEQARQAHAGGVRDVQAAPGLRARHPRADQVPAPAHPGRAPAPRALGRPRLSARPGGRRRSRSWRASSRWPTPTTR